MISELKLLKGSPIYVGNIPIYPLTIGEITDDIGEENYFKYLNIVTIDKIKAGIEDNISDFELICSLCIQNFPFYTSKDGKEECFKDVYLKGLEIFFRDKVEFIFDEDDKGNQYLFFLIGEYKDLDSKLITIQNYDEIIKVIKYQNCMMKNKSEEDENPANDKVRELLEKRKKARELVTKAKKSGDGEPLTLADLVSILVANGNGVTPFNVWDMNFYMFNNQFNRMRMLEEYDVNIRSLLAGAKPESIDLKHWMSKIE